jgi:hypothetical protein
LQCFFCFFQFVDSFRKEPFWGGGAQLKHVAFFIPALLSTSFIVIIIVSFVVSVSTETGEPEKPNPWAPQ